jgi:hypothetical protein
MLITRKPAVAEFFNSIDPFLTFTQVAVTWMLRIQDIDWLTSMGCCQHVHLPELGNNLFGRVPLLAHLQSSFGS